MSQYGYSKDYRLLKSNDFKNLRYNRFVIRKKYLSAYFKPANNDGMVTRIGMSVSRKVGKANFRNRLKRIIRETFRTSLYRNLGNDINFVVTTRCKIDNQVYFKKMVLEILEEIKNYHVK